MSGTNPRPRIERIASEPCPGPLVWFAVEATATEDAGAVLECATCGRVFTTGGYLDAEHAEADLLREGLGTS